MAYGAVYGLLDQVTWSIACPRGYLLSLDQKPISDYYLSEGPMGLDKALTT